MLYFAFFVKWVKSLTYLRMPKVCKKVVCLFLVRKRQRRSQLSHLIGYIKIHLKLWVCLKLQCIVLWMVRGLVSQIAPKKELKFWTTLIIVLLKEQSTRCTTICDKVCQWLATDRWFSPGTPVSSTQGRQENFWALEQKETWPPSSNSPNNDTQTNSTTVCHKQGISTTQINWWIVI